MLLAPVNSRTLHRRDSSLDLLRSSIFLRWNAGECARTGAEQVSTRMEDGKNRYFLSAKTRSVARALYCAHQTVGTAGYIKRVRWGCRVNFGPLAACNWRIMLISCCKRITVRYMQIREQKNVTELAGNALQLNILSSCLTLNKRYTERKEWEMKSFFLTILSNF